MKSVKTRGIFHSISFYMLIVMNGILIYLRLPLHYAIPAFIIGNICMYLAGVSKQYRVEYDGKQLIVKNGWNPFYFQGYYLTVIKKIEVDYYNNLGHGIAIFYDRNKDVFVCDSSREDLEAMADEINQFIKEEFNKK